MKQIVLPLVLTLFCACGSSDTQVMRIGDLEPLAAPDPDKGMQISIAAQSKAGEEVWACLVLDRLPVPLGTAFVNLGHAVHRQTPSMHHMDIMALGYAGVTLPAGQHDCKDIYQGEVKQAIMDKSIVLYASQRGEDEIVLPEGVAAVAPVDTQYMIEIHHVNTSDKDMEIGTYVNFDFIPDEQVKETIWGGAIRDLDIEVPARAKNHVEWTRCEMTDDADLIFVSSHSHELARKFEIRPLIDKKLGELVYENRDWESPFLRNFNPPLKLKKGDGFEFRCYYDSTRDTPTKWGLLAADEMCQIGIVFTPGRRDISCKITESGIGIPK